MLTLQFLPYSEIEGLSSQKRIAKLLNIAKDDKIVLLEGRLKKTEETELIQKTMEEINKEFTGIELAVVHPDKKSKQFLSKIKSKIISLLLGNRAGFTVVGPARIVTEIKQDPNKIQFLLNENSIKKMNDEGPKKEKGK